ncbi:MAG: flagellar export chaperone FliS [Deltaproteobacteria bacterium]|nr:flagellar export chaperone FliS [Deltaproteobacteria bacterium]
MDQKAVREEYLRRQIEGNDHGNLILMLYDACLMSLNLAKQKVVAKELEGTHNALIRAQNIIFELIGSLNFDAGGEIATNLANLYTFMNQRLIQANLKKRVDEIDQVTVLMTDLREAWQAVVTKSGQAKAEIKSEESKTTLGPEKVGDKPKKQPPYGPGKGSLPPGASPRRISIKG